jgi:hypothetical protein
MQQTSVIVMRALASANDLQWRDSPFEISTPLITD